MSEVVAAKIGARIADKPLSPEVNRTEPMRLFSDRCGAASKADVLSNKQHCCDALL